MSRRQPYEQPKVEDGAKVFWKSLEDQANPEAAQRRAEQEFLEPPGKLVQLSKKKKKTADDAEGVPLGRRGFMFFAGASAALFAEGCARRPVEKIMPYSKAPEQILPGVPVHFATVRQYRSDALGIVVESHEGRPTKIEGNRDHSASLGATDAFTQASVYEIYDPDRATTPTRVNKSAGPTDPKRLPAKWEEVDSALNDLMRTNTTDGGARLRLLVGPTTSPTFIRLRDAFSQKFPQAKVHVWAPVNESNQREGAKIAFGQAVNTIAAYSQSRVIVSLDCDFLGTEPGNVRANREFAETRRVHGPNDPMSRLYVVEPSFSITGMNADHRLRLAAGDVERYALLLAKELADKHAIDLGGIKDAAAKVDAAGIPPKWIAAVAKDLAGARAKSAIVAGTRQPPRVHALVHALNAALGNAGHTVNYYPVADLWETDPGASLKTLASDMETGKVGTLVMLGVNPVYDAPADVKFADKLAKVTTTFAFASHVDETAELCTWHVPRAHELESWGDARSLDGTVAIQQPLIAPIFSGRSDLEVLARLAGTAAPKGKDLVAETTKPALSSASSFSRAWNDALRRGVLGPSAKPFGPMDARRTEIASALGQGKPAKPPTADALEVTFAACPKVFDGRFANNPLLLELPDPVTKVSWDNVAFISEGTAKALGVENRQMIRLSRDGASPVDTCVWITPGQAENSIALFLGWGRKNAGRYGNKHGFDVNGLRTTDAMWIATGVKAAKLTSAEIDQTKDRYRHVGMVATDTVTAANTPFARIRPDDAFEADDQRIYKISQTQEHDTMEGRPVAVDTTLEDFRKNPVFPMYKDETHRDMDEHGKDIPVRKFGTPDPNVAPLWGNWKEEDENVGFKGHHRWGMGIDMSTCTGCNACVIACQVENNVPAVGKEQVWRGREMHWLRIDRYFVGLDRNDPEIVFQPVACVQCEEAPCENVCPVNATEHSPEGLNDMAYNRCIGTRYCANNCPYKVRRFNYLNFHTSGGWYDDVPEVEKMKYNPNVTVRMRGVMEKCTYCVQRIQEAKIESKRKGTPDAIKRIQTACQQACPAGAIVFGDLTDPQARVTRWRASGRSYRLLSELGTRPRTTHLGKVRNPNPEMA